MIKRVDYWIADKSYWLWKDISSHHTEKILTYGESLVKLPFLRSTDKEKKEKTFHFSGYILYFDRSAIFSRQRIADMFNK